jgi:hypothetical protein
VFIETRWHRDVKIASPETPAACLVTTMLPNESAGLPHAPYSPGEVNLIYNLLFCDNLDAFRPQDGKKPAEWQSLLFGAPANADAVLSLAEDAGREGRVRFLGYQWLRSKGRPVPKQKLLGVIVEIALAQGLDVLAASCLSGCFSNRITDAIDGVPNPARTANLA